MTNYPWYSEVRDDSLEQGDLFELCPVFIPTLEADEGGVADFDLTHRDVVVMSQSCDLVKGREKVMEVLLCAVWNRSELSPDHVSTPKGMDDARKGNLPGFHLLAPCELAGLDHDVRIVDFRCVHSLPIQLLRKLAANDHRRIRLLPPYREHLSQAFARFFMRVGLPVDIPPFKQS
ncbi:MAG: hypothetical protein HZA46_16590 [Planctomycetales bacterium]|nr:hypothetical protein [Planctomycetales bacterium]